jgi:hypothetical protein
MNAVKGCNTVSTLKEKHGQGVSGEVLRRIL